MRDELSESFIAEQVDQMDRYERRLEVEDALRLYNLAEKRRRKEKLIDALITALFALLAAGIFILIVEAL